MKKLAIKITDEAKLDFFKKYPDMCKRAFAKGASDMFTEHVVEQIREQFGYSPKTYYLDIYRSWENSYKLLVGR